MVELRSKIINLEAASSIASLTTEKNALETSKQELEAENAELMNVSADALADGFELAFQQIWTLRSSSRFGPYAVLPNLDLTQFSIYHEVVDGKLNSSFLSFLLVISYFCTILVLETCIDLGVNIYLLQLYVSSLVSS